MKDSIEGILFIVVVLAMFFLFQGEPDLWDKLHEKAMKSVQGGDTP